MSRDLAPTSISVADVCDGACAYVLPAGLPDVTALADGRVVGLRRDARGVPVFPLQLVQGQISLQQWQDLLALADRAGVPDHVVVPTLPPGRAVADGGMTVLTVRYAAGPARRVSVPLLSLRDLPLRPAASRDRLLALVDALAAVRPGADAAALPATAYALLAEQSGADGATPGPALEVPASGCRLLSPQEAAALPEEVRAARAPVPVTEGGRARLVSLRPLLPTERSCADLGQG
ncbi:hypothetical protein EV189_0102 [Motilibacter rhizosphaerae]|uniref:Uncharacterized protein n=1 Tax=Motilibacter rhizosphaerae TaxID=598652 RepID=A0A4Q7NWU4_9ACTN|nr:hypothetical protein EV189_0102 [Motilibacter rhizosphaerae]